jgi:hypothetical protein
MKEEVLIIVSVLVFVIFSLLQLSAMKEFEKRSDQLECDVVLHKKLPPTSNCD